MLLITLVEFEDWLYFKNSYAKADIYTVLFKKAYTYFLYLNFSLSECINFMRSIWEEVEQEKISPSTYNNHLKALKLLIKASNSPFILPLKGKPTERGYISTLEDDEVHKTLNKWFSVKDNYRQAVAYQVLVEHGLRFENVRYMKWENVYDDEIFIDKTKTNKSYTIEISKELRKKIERLRENHPTYVFSTYKGYLHRARFNQQLHRIMQSIGITKHITAHKLRHTNATLQAEKDINLKTISENLGHSSVKTTEGYVHVSKSAKRKATRKLGISKFTFTEEEIRKEVNDFILNLNQGGVQAFSVPQNINIVITIPIKNS